MALQERVNTGLTARSDLEFARTLGYRCGVDVGDVAFAPDQATGPLQRCVEKSLETVVNPYESHHPRDLLVCVDCIDRVLLQVERLWCGASRASLRFGRPIPSRGGWPPASMPASAAKTWYGTAAADLEHTDDRHDRQCVGPIAVETAYLKGESALIDQQPDHDRRVSYGPLDGADGLDPELARWTSMTETVFCVGGRAPPRRNSLLRSESGCHDLPPVALVRAP